MRTLFVIILLMLACVKIAISQEIPPTGDADLTQSDVNFVFENMYMAPLIEGAAIESPSVDNSVKGNWMLEIRNQGQQNSCQSFAVAYAIDILDRPRFHSPTYLWDVLSYRRLSSLSPPPTSECVECSQTAEFCLKCKEGISIVNAISSALIGLPSIDNYTTTNSCGRQKPLPEFAGSQKYSAWFIWLDRRFYPSNLNYEPVTSSPDEALEFTKSRLLDGYPVLISIWARPFADYTSGVVSNLSLTPSSSNWHAMTIVGYDNNKKSPNGEPGAFKIANSWPGKLDGSLWGEDGYLWISYSAFLRYTRLISFIGPKTQNNAGYNWKAKSIYGDGLSAKGLEPDDRIGVFQLELLELAANGTKICLDANTWYPDRSPFEIIGYKCHLFKDLESKVNQNWDIRFKVAKESNDYYVLRSISNDNQVLAVKDRKLVLEPEKAGPDEAQLWLIRRSPVTGARAIAWAGQGGEFFLHFDQQSLLDYDDNKAAQTSLLLDTFNNLPRQTWYFRCTDIHSQACRALQAKAEQGQRNNLKR
jgi:hypothetical protein